ncbi:MAG TPA: membrane protein insertase YidC [Candidatus Krumholzibacteriaceae bacterium]|nr:membrane protein insertase YidC [Candidatus Krumholzibacteriaceae bacterium]
MDKRSLLAIVVTFLVLILWQTLYVAPRRENNLKKEYSISDSTGALRSADPEREEITRQSRPAEEESRREPGEKKEKRFYAPADSGRALTLTVSTEVMDITLVSEGGEIEQAKLYEYRGDKGEPLELLPEGEKGGLAVELKKGGLTEDFGGALFSVSVDGNQIDADRTVRLGDEREEVEIVFRKEVGGGDFLEKRFVFFKEGYEFRFSTKMQRQGPLREADSFAVAWNCGLVVTEENESVDKQGFASLGKVGEEFYKETLGDFGDGKTRRRSGQVIWAGVRTKYFISAIIEDNPSSATLELRGSEDESFVGYAVVYPFRGDPREVEKRYRGYIGPLDADRLSEFNVGLEKSVELGWLRFLSVIVLKVMLFFRRFIPNYGLIIILMSVITKVLFYRLTHKSFKSMKDMQKLQPKIKELQDKYKDDKEELNKRTMKLYKEAGVNPLGGCLPLVFQMPVFIALFGVLRNTIELRNAPFMLWIDDLSAPDVLFNFGFSIPFLGDAFHLLPILMGGAMVLQSKLGGSPTGGSAPPGQTKMMSTMMPIIFTFIFYGMPSGLVLYWIVNNVLTILQQYYAHKESEKEDELAAEKGKEK